MTPRQLLDQGFVMLLGVLVQFSQCVHCSKPFCLLLWTSLPSENSNWRTLSPNELCFPFFPKLERAREHLVVRLVPFLWEIVFTLCLWPEINKLDCVIVTNVHRIFLQGAFFNCSHPKISKYKKKTKYPNCSHPKISKYKKKTKYPNCSHPKMS